MLYYEHMILSVNLKILRKINDLLGNSSSELNDMFEEILTEQSKYDEMEKEEEYIKKFYAGVLEINSKKDSVMNNLKGDKLQESKTSSQTVAPTTDSQEVLRIKSVTIKNFRAYHGDSGPILFSRNQKSPLTIFHGTNGLGKTSLFNAIHWGIYGKERKSKDHKAKSEGIVNSYIIDTLEDGHTDEMFVKIQIENQHQDLQYEIQRKISLVKEGLGKDLVINDILGGKIPRSVIPNSEVTFSYRDPDSDDGELIKTSNQFTVDALLKKIFPRNLSNFFLLDGELLDDFLNGNDVFVKNGIEQISQLPLLQNCKKYVKSASSKVGTKATTNRTQYTLKEESISKKQKLKTKLEIDIPQINTEIKKLQKELDYGITLILKYDSDTIKEKQNSIQTGKSALSLMEQQIKDNKKKIQYLVYNNLDKILMKKTYYSASKKYDQYIAEKKLPSKFSKDILEQLLHSHECVCGRNLDQDQTAINTIQEMLNVSYDSTLGHSMNKIVEQTNDVVKNFNENENLLKQISECNDEISKYRTKRTDIKNTNNALEKELDKVNIAELNEIRDKNDKLKIKIKDLSNQNHDNQTLLDGCITGLVSDEREFMILKRNTIKDDHANNKMDLASFIQNILDKAHEQLRKEFVDEVKSATEELFLKTAPQKEVFPKINCISIDPDTFAISALRDTDKTKDISRGQAHVLGISFINAIRKITTKNYFMIIDSPFNNISQKERIDICKELKTSHKNTQLTFLVTDSEYEGDVKKTNLSSVRDTLMEHELIGCEYNLSQKPLAKIKSQEYFNTTVGAYV
jgi:DNA sulfur modification protein DndD